MTELLHTAPYFSTFDPKTNYKFIAFKANTALQVRELNEVQEMQATQTHVISDHLFKQGTKVSNGNVTLSRQAFVRLNLALPVNTKYLRTVSGLEAIVTLSDGNINYIIYNKADTSGREVFIEGEAVQAFDINGNLLGNYAILIKNSVDDIPTIGQGLIATVAEGTFYLNNMFINTSKIVYPVMKYSTDLSCHFGLLVNEKVITYEDDEALLDNAAGFNNEFAPGADRVLVNVSPIVLDINATIDNNKFIKLASFNNGELTFLMKDTQYSSIMDMIAKRTFDESGHYTVDGFGLSLREHIKNATHPQGIYINGNEANLCALISPGRAYVNGYLVETIADTVLTLDKARDFTNIKDQTISIPEHQYIKATYAATTGTNRPGTNNFTNIYETTNIQLLNSNDVVIGNAFITDVVPESSAALTLTSVFKVYIHAISLTSGSINDIRKLSVNTGALVFAMNVVVEGGAVRVYNSGNDELVFNLNYNYLKSLTPNGQSKLNIQYNKQFTGILDNTGSIIFNAGTGNIFVPNGKPYSVAVAASSNINPTRYSITENGSGNLYIDVNNTNTATLKMTGYEGQYVTLTLRVMENRMSPAIKTLHNTVQSFSVASPYKFNLKSDVLRINKIETYTGSGPKTDVTSLFKFNNGQYPHLVENASIQLIGASSALGASIDVSYDYFLVTENGSPVFFTVDSYMAEVNNPDKDFAYNDIPSFINDNQTFDLKNCIDFRPIRKENGTVTKSVPISFKFPIQYDAEIYTKRVDSIVINDSGELAVIRGIPNTVAAVPITPNNMLKLYDIYLNEYTFENVMIKSNYTKRYTMNDIHRISERIKALEYYVALSLLEQRTLDMTIKDADGNDRFKNGFMVDNFSKFQSADINNKEYRASNDSVNKELKPAFYMRSLPLVINKALSSSTKINSDMIFIPNYTNEVLLEQPLASKHISINPYYIFAKKGTLSLFPNMDTWTDTTQAPNIQFNIDNASNAIRALAERTGAFNTQWGAWAQTNRIINSVATNVSVSSQSSISGWGFDENIWRNVRRLNTDTTTTSATTTVGTDVFARSGTAMSLSERVEGTTIRAVTDVKLEPFVRPRTILLVANGLKAGSILNVFFDKEKLSHLCAPLLGAQGSPLVVDNTGTFIGWLSIPGNTFYSGDHKVVLSPANTLDDVAEYSSLAESTYYSAGLNQTVQNTQINVTTPILDTRTVTEERQSTWSTTNINRSTSRSSSIIQVWSGDPIAQSFYVPNESFISGLDLYFASKDTNDSIWVELRELDAGVPKSTAIARKVVKLADVAVSNNATTKTFVSFDQPVHVSGDTFYAVVIGGASPDTRYWVAELGKPNIANNTIIETNNAEGVSFRSQNGTTWTAEQKEDLKITIYRARFNELVNTIYLEPSQDKHVYLKAVTGFETETGVNRIRVFCKDHGLLVNDYVSIVNYGSLRVNSTSIPYAGQIITTSTGSCEITSVQLTDEIGYYICEYHNMIGYIAGGANYTTNQITMGIPDIELVNIITPINNTNRIVPSGSGIVSSITNSVSNINGIDSSAIFSNTLQVIGVDSLDSFIIQVSNNATSTGIVNKQASALCNIEYDVYNISWDFDAGSVTNKHEIISTEKISYVKNSNKEIVPGNDNYMIKTGVITSPLNAGKVSGKSLVIKSTFTSPSHYVAPFINLASASLVGISYRVFDFNNSICNVSPNAANRFIDETNKDSGLCAYKYVSKTMKLEQTANDVMIMLDVYKPLYSDFDIYVKLKSSTETADIEDKNWVLVTGIDKTVVSNNLDDRKEISITLSENQESLVAGGFTFVKVKIIGKTTNKANPPIFTNLRVLALT